MRVTLDDGRVTLDRGQVVDTPDYIAKDWIAHGYAVVQPPVKRRSAKKETASSE
jgi:hypothetical protein